MEAVKRKAAEDPDAPSDDIVKRAKENLSEEVIVRMPRDVTLLRHVQKSRIQFGASSVDKKEMRDIIWDDRFTQTKTGENFMVGFYINCTYTYHLGLSFCCSRAGSARHHPLLFSHRHEDSKGQSALVD